MNFFEAWNVMISKGYQYGSDALVSVKLGWDMRVEAEREECSGARSPLCAAAASQTTSADVAKELGAPNVLRPVVAAGVEELEELRRARQGLVDFFRAQGVAFGWWGDCEHWAPERTAVEVMKKLSAELDEVFDVEDLEVGMEVVVYDFSRFNSRKVSAVVVNTSSMPRAVSVLLLSGVFTTHGFGCGDRILVCPEQLRPAAVAPKRTTP